MNISANMPDNVKHHGYARSKSGKLVTLWEVQCIKCGKIRKVKRADHARGHATKPCKYCSNKNNHPQEDYRGLRVSFINRYAIHAKSRQKTWKLTLDELADLAEKQNKTCVLSGIALKFNGNFNEITASLDRIDNNRGYELDNIQWVHKEINMMRGMLNVKRFIELCKAVANRVKW